MMGGNRRGALTRSLALLVVAAALAGGCAPDIRRGPAAPSESQGILVVFGDSLAVSPDPARAFPAVLRSRILASGLTWSVINNSRSGETTTGGLARFDEVLAERPDVLVLELGANDGLQRVDVGTIRANLGAMIRLAKENEIRVLLCGMETLPSSGLTYAAAFHDIFPALAEEHDVPLVPFLLAGVVGNPNLNESDLVHPNAEGARRIADTVWPFLQPMLVSIGLLGSNGRS